MKNFYSVMRRVLLCLLSLTLMIGFAACNKPSVDPDSNDPTGDPVDPPAGDDPIIDDPAFPIGIRYNPHAEARAEGADTITLREYSRVDGTLIDPDADALSVPAGLTELVNMYMTEYDPVKMEGTVSTFQNASSYSDALRINTEAMMAYISTPDSVDRVMESWCTADDFYEVNVMMPVNRDSNDYVLRDPSNYDDIQTDATGKYITHSTSSTVYYMVPTEGWIDYVWEMVEALIDHYDVKSITFEEPEMWYASGYSEGFKREWEDYYGEAWQAQTASPEAMLKTMRLKVYLFDRMLSEIADRLHAAAPDTKLYVASHSTASYTGIQITAGLNTYLATGKIDGVVGQTWSNTASAAVKVDGVDQTLEFANAYLGYASYAGAAGDLDLYAITDTMSDTPSWGENVCFPKYKATLVSALMQPEIHRFESAVWPSRGFAPVSADYRTLQLACYEAINEMSGKAMTVSAGTPGITYLLSDSLSFQSGSSAWSMSSKDGYYGVTMPLLLDGIPLSIKSMEQLTSPEDLEGVNLLILSWDCQKPMNEECVAAIAQWILAGGTALYVGGHDRFAESETEWWASAGTPLQALFDQLGLDITVTKPTLSDCKATWLEDSDYKAIADMTLPAQYAAFYAGFEGADVNAVLKVGDTVLGIDQTAGKGHIVAVGIPSALFSLQSGGSDAMQAITAYACDQHAEYLYSSTTLMWAKRGRIVAAHSYADGNVLVGKFVNLFDPALTVTDHVVIDAGEDVLLCDVSDMDLSTPRILYSGGAHVYAPREKDTSTIFCISGPANTLISTRLGCTDGKYPISVTATDAAGNAAAVYTAWNNETDTLLIQVDGRVDGVTVEVMWGDTHIEDTKQKIRETFTVETNKKNLDAAWLYRNDAGADNNLRFADASGQLIYKIDLTPFDQPTIGLHIVQNYIVEYSYDGKAWTVLADYSKTEGYSGTLIGGGNNTVIMLDSMLLDGYDEVYIRIRDCNPGDGWGGSISKIEVTYMRDEDEEPFALPAPDEEKPQEPTGDASAFEKLNVDYASLYADRQKATFTVNQNSTEDAALIYKDTSAANASYKYTDAANELIYRIDLSEYENAVAVFTVAQNYFIQVSDDGKSWTTIQDFALVNGGRIEGTGNKATVGVSAEKYAPDGDHLYVRFACSDTSAGWGSSVEKIVIYYE